MNFGKLNNPLPLFPGSASTTPTRSRAVTSLVSCMASSSFGNTRLTGVQLHPASKDTRRSHKPPFKAPTKRNVEIPPLSLPPRRYLRTWLKPSTARSNPAPKEDPYKACSELLTSWRSRMKKSIPPRTSGQDAITPAGDREEDEITPVEECNTRRPGFDTQVTEAGPATATSRQDVFAEALQNTLAHCTPDARLSLLPRIGKCNPGFTMMQKMGWHPAEGLGPNGEGRTQPVSITFRPDGERKRRGLGYTDGLTAGQRYIQQLQDPAFRDKVCAWGDGAEDAWGWNGFNQYDWSG